MSLEIIKTNLTDRFSAPLEDFYIRRIVFWHDEDKEFIDTIDELELDDVKVIKLTGSNNFAVKKLLTADDLTSNYLVYNPISYEKDEDNWLLDMELYSEVFRADYFSMKMDELHIENSAIMRKAIKVYPKFLENKERRTALRRMGRDYNSPLQLHIDILSVLCGLKEGSSSDMIIAVLSNGLDKESNNCLGRIEKFGNIHAFWELVRKYTGYIYDDSKTLSDFACHLLITALSQTIAETELKGLERYISDSNKAYCYSLVRDWISDERRDDLVDVARMVEAECNLLNRFYKMEMETLAKADVFPLVNEVILSRFFAEINEQVIKVDFILEVGSVRRTASWFDLTENYFDCLYNIAKMKEFQLENIKGFHIVEPKKICNLYTDSAYKMDTYYRHFHLAFSNTLVDTNSMLEDLLKTSADYVEGLYQNWYLKELNDCWSNSVTEDLSNLGYVSEIQKQRGFYNHYVNSSAMKNSKVFVVISDALRYEVALEVKEQLVRSTKGTASIEPMQSIFPSITSFGMAALLPNKEISIQDDDGKVSVWVDGNNTSGRANREKILQQANTKSVAIRYKDLIEMKPTERRDIGTGKEVIYIYHDAIDAIGDKAPTERKVFEACETAIRELSNIVRIITSDMNGTNVLITADHGFLYTYKPLSESQKISKSTFNGKCYEVGRRYAVVNKDTTAEFLTQVAIGGEIKGLDVTAFALKDTTRIKISGGGENYVHGGMSLQEMIVPVITYKNLRATSKHFKETENAEIGLLSENRKISNLIFSLDFFQKTPVGDKITPCMYNVYFTDEEGSHISDTQTIIADRKSTNASERVYRVRFNLKSKTFDRNKIYRLVIANDTDMPIEVEYKIDIAFADDFGFDF